jgi:hypothetical protein
MSKATEQDWERLSVIAIGRLMPRLGSRVALPADPLPSLVPPARRKTIAWMLVGRTQFERKEFAALGVTLPR